METALVCRPIVALGGVTTVRAGTITNNGNSIIDITALSFVAPVALETALNQLPGTAFNGIFALRWADVCSTASVDGVSVQSAWGHAK